MDSKELKEIFDLLAKENGFVKAYGAWFKESDDGTVVLELQKSSYSNSYYLNIKGYIKGVFGRSYSKSKELAKSAAGHISKQVNDNSALDLEIHNDKAHTSLEIQKLFQSLINPLADVALSRKKTKEMASTGKLFLLPVIKEQLELLET
ncbi:DUF4304 domain-containing protein [Pedobacter deserti]|uniref:DUF4304 domain-containing protein n=1 Tax=Pedobacter deserti TaxID=2817382 RepID=UPI00210D1A50|nr:DUF4304 domain-containing protein [Pedobacter sp. SYSU D00382]